MNYPMRSIAFISEMIHAPLIHQAADLQKVHNLTFSDQVCQYKNFQMLPVGAQMSNPPKRHQSISCCTYLNDRIQIREEMTGISREDYENRIQRLADIVMDNLNIQAFHVQQFVVRTLINPRHYTDSREFVSKALCNMESEDFAPFGRSMNLLGLRFALGAPGSKEGDFNLRVESFAQDTRSLFIENIGVYRTVIKRENIGDITSNFSDTYSYIETAIIPFLSQFDETE